MYCSENRLIKGGETREGHLSKRRIIRGHMCISENGTNLKKKSLNVEREKRTANEARRLYGS
jgi:hypothetical protein